MHINKDLGSIKSSPSKTSESIKREFTCCSKSFARDLVIGPILISLGLFIIGSSLDVGGATVVGMSSSSPPPSKGVDLDDPRSSPIYGDKSTTLKLLLAPPNSAMGISIE